MKRLMFLAVAAFASSDAYASETTFSSSASIDLREAQDLLERSFDLRRARARAEVGERVAVEATWRIAPFLQGQLGLTRVDGATQSSSSGAFEEAVFTTANPYARIAYATNPAEAIYAAVAAHRREDALEDGIRSTARLVELRVAEQFFDLARASENIPVANLAVEDARALLRIAEVLERQGQARGDDVARAESELANAVQNRIRATRAAHQASIILATTLDRDPAILLVPRIRKEDAKAAVRDAERLVERALGLRPEIKEAESQRRAADAEITGAWLSLVAPSVELFYQEGGLGPGYADLGRRRAYGALLSWTLSGAAIARVSTFHARAEEAALDVEEAKQRVVAEVTSALDELRLAAARVPPAARAVASAEDALRISNVRFRSGTAIIVEVIQAQRAVELARLRRIGAGVELGRARARLHAAIAERAAEIR